MNLRILLVAITANVIITLGILRWHESALLEKLSTVRNFSEPQVQIDQLTPEQRLARREGIARQVRALAERFIREAQLDAAQTLRLRQVTEKYISESIRINERGTPEIIAKESAELQNATNLEIEGIVSPEQYLVFLRLLNTGGEHQ